MQSRPPIGCRWPGQSGPRMSTGSSPSQSDWATIDSEHTPRRKHPIYLHARLRTFAIIPRRRCPLCRRRGWRQCWGGPARARYPPPWRSAPHGPAYVHVRLIGMDCPTQSYSIAHSNRTCALGDHQSDRSLSMGETPYPFPDTRSLDASCSSTPFLFCTEERP
jgi:hypothetical protein